MRPQRKRMIVETTRAFVKLKQNKAAVSAGGTKFYFMFVETLEHSQIGHQSGLIDG